MDKSKDELIEELKKISSKRIEEIISILSEIHEKEKIIVPNKIDKNSMVCFVLSCPGREEIISDTLHVNVLTICLNYFQ